MALIPATQFIHHCYCSLFSPTNKQTLYCIYTFLCYFRIWRQATYDKFYYLLILRQVYVLCVRKRRSGQFIMTLFYLRVSAGIKHILKLKLFFGAAVHLLMEYFEIFLYFLVKASIKLF